MATQDRADGSRRHVECLGDVLLAPPRGSPQFHDGEFDFWLRAAGAPVRTRRSVNQPGRAFLEESAYPSIRTLSRYTEFSSDMSGFTTADQNPVDEKLTTMNGQARISVGHEDLRV